MNSNPHAGLLADRHQGCVLRTFAGRTLGGRLPQFAPAALIEVPRPLVRNYEAG
jgi:hypothetical protein